MKVKRYVGDTMQEAFEAVKKDLGSDAIILRTKTTKKRGVMGLLGKEMVEITASTDVNIVEEKKTSNSYLSSLYQQSGAEEKQEVKKSEPYKEAQGFSSDTYQRIVQFELSEIKKTLEDVLKKTEHSELSYLPETLMDFYLILMEQQVSKELSKEIINSIHNELRAEELSNKEKIKQTLEKVLVKLIKNAQPIKLDKPAKKVALIGPTGVGKTTTIAKLAAHYTLREDKRVAFITIDTYRIAAVEQLRTYAEIINIPIEVVLTPLELKKALHKFKDFDLILIDTAGRSQRNEKQLLELKTYLDTIQADETHLVLSTITNYQNVMDTIENFQQIGFDKLIFTKIDETVNFGVVLNVVQKVSKSLSYLTTGQNVPDDIEVSDPGYLANLILGGNQHDA